LGFNFDNALLNF